MIVCKNSLYTNTCQQLFSYNYKKKFYSLHVKKCLHLLDSVYEEYLYAINLFDFCEFDNEFFV